MQHKKGDYTLNKSDDQLVWTIHALNGEKLGTIEIDLEGSDYCEAPVIKLVSDRFINEDQGIVGLIIKDTIRYAYCNLPYQELYARHEVANKADEKLYKSLGFEADGKAYKDDDGQEWQNVKIVL